MSAAGIALALGVALLLMALRATPPMPPATSVRQLDLAVPRLAALESLALSPDGEHLAFIAHAADTTAVWIRSLGEPVAWMVQEHRACSGWPTNLVRPAVQKSIRRRFRRPVRSGRYRSRAGSTRTGVPMVASCCSSIATAG